MCPAFTALPGALGRRARGDRGLAARTTFNPEFASVDTTPRRCGLDPICRRAGGEEARGFWTRPIRMEVSRVQHNRLGHRRLTERRQSALRREALARESRASLVAVHVVQRFASKGGLAVHADEETVEAKPTQVVDGLSGEGSDATLKLEKSHRAVGRARDRRWRSGGGRRLDRRGTRGHGPIAGRSS